MLDRTCDLTSKEVRHLFDYNEKTGDLIWKVERYRKHPGDIAGCKHVTKIKKYRRVSVSINYRRYLAHRIIWLWVTGKWPEVEIDHIDGDGWNNKFDNLREATHPQNGKNLGLKKSNTSGATGVRKSKYGYSARIMVNYKEVYLGIYKSFEAAVAARKCAEQKYFGEFARK
jgi:hypothetical protein